MRAFALFYFIMFFSISSFADDTKDKVYSLFLYTFARYTQWPEINKSSQFVITVVGKASDWSQIKDLEGKKNVYGLPIKVRFVEDYDQLYESHIVLITKPYFDQEKFLKAHKPSHALIVTEQIDSLAKGVDVNMFFKEGKFRFEMDYEGIESRGLKVAAQLKNMSL